MQELIDQLITTGVGLGLLGGTYLVWLLTGVANNLFSTKKWSWKRTLEDIAKTCLMCVAIMAWVAVCYGVDWFAAKMGADISALLQGASVAGVIGGIIGGTVYYLGKAYNNIIAFVNANHVEVEVKNPDYKAVADTARAIAEAVTPAWTVDEKQTNAEAAAEAISQVGKGEFVNPLDRRLPDGDDDSGNGWQCSKYSYYLGTGIVMHYAPHPDYGPCNGRDMVSYLINNCGFVACGKINGAIFSYDAGEYGHTGMVLDAASNTVNDANWTPLRVSTHYLNLDAMGATYCCPPEMLKPDPTPVPTPTPAPAPTSGFKVWDKVVPTRLVDYYGTPLVQYDDFYTISELDGDRAVLTADRNGEPVVWAAMNTKDLRKV